MKNIKMIKVHQIYKNGRWVRDKSKGKEICYIDYDTYLRIVSPKSVEFFKELGETEKPYRFKGQVVKTVSTSLDNTTRVICLFQHGVQPGDTDLN